jgi:8-oxo-dGTP diphosphatase
MRTIRRDIAGAFIFSNDGHILLGNNGSGGVYSDSWVIPGGGIEPDEEKIDAAKREVLEETGIDVSNADIQPYNEVLTGESEKTLKESGERVLVQMKFYNFIIKIAQPASKIVISLNDDLSEAQWFRVDKLNNMKFSPSVNHILVSLGYLSELSR